MSLPDPTGYITVNGQMEGSKDIDTSEPLYEAVSPLCSPMMLHEHPNQDGCPCIWRYRWWHCHGGGKATLSGTRDVSRLTCRCAAESISMVMM